MQSPGQRPKPRGFLEHSACQTLPLDRCRRRRGITEAAFAGQGELAWMAMQQGTKFSFRLAKTVKTGYIEMADSQIHGLIKQALLLRNLR